MAPQTWHEIMFPMGPPLWHRVLLIYLLAIAGMLWSELAFWSAASVAWPGVSSLASRIGRQLGVAGGYSAGTFLALEIVEIFGSLIVRVSEVADRYRHQRSQSEALETFPGNARFDANEIPHPRPADTVTDRATAELHANNALRNVTCTAFARARGISSDGEGNEAVIDLVASDPANL